MAVEQLGGKPQLAADLADFVLIERLQRLHDAPCVDQLLDAGTRLWWVLMTAALEVPPDSMVSG